MGAFPLVTHHYTRHCRSRIGRNTDTQTLPPALSNHGSLPPHPPPPTRTQAEDDRWLPMLITGALMFIPGSYHVWVGANAYLRRPGYSFADIPSYDD